MGQTLTHGDYSMLKGNKAVRMTKGNDSFDSDNFSSSGPRNDKALAKANAAQTAKAHAIYGERYIIMLGAPSGEVKTLDLP